VAIILPPQPWTKQPQIAVGIASQFVPRYVWAINNGSSLSGPSVIARTGTIGAPTVASFGRAMSHNGSSEYQNWAFPNTASVGPFVIGGVFTVTDTATADQTAVGVGDGVTSSGGLFGGVGQRTATIVQSWLRTQNGGADDIISGPTAVIGTTYAVVRIHSSSGSVMFVNGVRYTGAGTGDDGASFWGNLSTGGTNRAGNVIFFGKANVGLGFADFGRAPDEVWAREWSKNPWQLFASLPRRIFPGPAGAASNDGTLARTNANDTSAASGSVTNTGTLARTNANDTSAASGSQTNTGTLARTNANDSVSASGSTSGTNDGTLATTNANDTSAASGTQTNTGTLARTNANDGVAASGTAGTISGTVAYTNANDALTATGGGGQTRGGISRHKETKVKKSSTAVRDILRDIIDPQPAEIAQEMREAVLEASAPEVQVNAPSDEQEQEARRIARRRSVLHLLMQD
jgi:hypothetical protein